MDHYYGFDLRLSNWDPATHSGTAEVLGSPAGECAPYTFTLDIDIAAASGRVQRTASEAIDLGQLLARSIMRGDALTLWYESYQLARERERGLRLRLHIAAWELCRLPWELLYDDRRHEFVVFDPMVSLVRYIRLQGVQPRLRQSRSVRILVVTASPKDQLQLDWQHEVGVLQQALGELIQMQQVEVAVLEHATPDRLHTALLELTPHVVHYIGHAEFDPRTRHGTLALENELGSSAPMDAIEAARLLRRYRTNLVVLNACDTATGSWAGLAPALVRAEIPAVVAMQWPVEDTAAIRFSRAFYRALAKGQPVDACVSEGRLGASMGSRDPNDWAAPVLFLRSLSGQLWVPGQADAPARAELPAEPSTPIGEAVGVQRGMVPTEALFKTRGPLVAPADATVLVERRELERVLRIVRLPAVTQYVAILSTRQTGKTTLLFSLMDRLRDDCLSVFVDLSVLRAQDSGHCFRHVAFQMLTDLEARCGQELSLPKGDAIETATDFERFLSQFASVAPTSRIVLLLDEVGGLSREASDSFFNAWRAIFHHGRSPGGELLAKYLCVFSGAVDLQHLTHGMNSPLNICEKVYLADLEPAQVGQIVSNFARLGIDYAPALAEHVYELTRGHPYLTMRLCALAQASGAETIEAETIDSALERLLSDDDNISHVIHRLEANPQARRRVKSILDGRRYHFMRSDPLLSSLELIGVIAGTQPCTLRNPIYERALGAYFANSASLTASPGGGSEATPSALGLEATYERLDGLRRQAQDARGRFVSGASWRTFCAALFSLVPSLSLYPSLQVGLDPSDLLLTVEEGASQGGLWARYRPGVLVTLGDIGDDANKQLARRLVRARELRCGLIVWVTSSPESGAGAARVTGRHDGVDVVVLDAVDLTQVISERRDLAVLVGAKAEEARRNAR